MTKDQALELLDDGKKLTHKSFTNDEWMRKSGNKYQFEDGNLCPPDDFWYYRDCYAWLDGWELYSK